MLATLSVRPRPLPLSNALPGKRRKYPYDAGINPVRMAAISVCLCPETRQRQRRILVTVGIDTVSAALGQGEMSPKNRFRF